MKSFSRREFLRLASQLAAAMGLGSAAVPELAQAIEKLASGRCPVLWLQGQSCTGCSVSFLNADEPGPAQILTNTITLLFHPNLSSATGEQAMGVVQAAIDRGGLLLVVEGSIPAAMPEACVVGHVNFGDLVVKAAARSQAVVALGACAAFGGIPAAEGNPTGAQSVPDFFKSHGITTPTIRLPGCPPHPDWLVGTLAHVLSYGMPALDEKQRPKMFFHRMLHDQCPRFADYERERFAATFAEDGCLFKLGCVGASTRSDCSLRFWNGGVNTCIKSGAPCIGCAGEEFALRRDFPFYTLGTSRSPEEHKS